MAAFDSTSNFNATFTNSYATVSLDAVSTAAQLAAGFVRRTGQKYFEFVVNQAGNKPEKLWLGVYWGGGGAQGWAIGGNSETGTIISSGIDTVRTPVPGLSLATGDVISFAVDFDGGESPDGSSVTAGAPGIGQVSVAKNGVWTSAKLIFPNAGPFVSGMRPMVIREKAGGLSIGAVTLRVDSLSFSYLPTGWTEWGQSGGVTYPAAATLTWGWSGTEKAPAYTVSAGGFYPNERSRATATLSGSTVYATYHKADALPISSGTSSMLQFEYYYSNTASINVWMNNLYLLNQGKATLTATIPGSLTLTPGVYLSSTSPATVWTDGATGAAMNMGPFANAAGKFSIGAVKGMGFLFSPTRGMLGTYGSYPIYSVTADGIFNPAIGTQSPWISITSSTTMRLGRYYRNFDNIPASSQTAAMCLNAGQYRFLWPMYPGTKSVDNTRGVVTSSYSWVITGTICSTATTAETLIRIGSGGTSTFKRGRLSKGHATGKKVFELILNTSSFGLSNQAYMGVTRDDPCSFSVSTLYNNTSYYGVIWANGPVMKRVNLTGTISVSGYAYDQFNDGEGLRATFAIDLDAGHMWVGLPTQKRYSITWLGGGNPALGTLPYITLSPSTTFFPVVGANNSGGGGIDVTYAIAAQDDAFRYDPPTGFQPWDSSSMNGVTTTATVTPSVTITPSSSGTTGGGNGVLWPFGVRP